MTASETKDRASVVTASVGTRASDAFAAARDAAVETADQVRAGAAFAAAAAAEAIPEVMSKVREGVDGVAERLPDALEAARTTAVATTDSLRDMPRSTLRVLAALSVGMGIGLYLAGAPRLVTIAAFSPALLAALAVTFDGSPVPEVER